VRFLALILAALAYAILRYGFANDVPLNHWPAYILNKAVAYAALGCLVMAFWGRDEPERRRRCFSLAFLLGSAHAFASAAMLGGGYYKELAAADGLLDWRGEVALAAGAAALALLFAPRVEKGADRRVLTMWLFAVVGVHMLGLGAAKWFTPGSWAWGLPPISLLSFLTAIAGFVLAARSGKGRAGR